MKKQLYRVKQLADQRVGRAEKTDLLTEDLQHVEKTLDKIKIACTNTSKKIHMCQLSTGPDNERRKRKLNQYQVGQGMLECAGILGDASLLGNILLNTGESQSAIANELAVYETSVDESVLAPMNNLLEVDIPNIFLTKKKLSKARLDMDACKTRWLNAVKLSQTGKGNQLENVAKADLVKSEFEDQTAMFQSLQDSLATEMFSFVAGERSYSEWFVKLIEQQVKFHQASLEILTKCLPTIQQQLDESMFRPVFSCPLEIHLRVTDREIAFVLEECILFILDTAMDVEGLFRLAGSASKIKKLKAAFDAGIVDMEDFVNEIHAVTGVLKLYLRELPEPLLTFELYDEWIESSRIKDRDTRLQSLWSLIERLPQQNKANLRYLVCFLSKLAEQSEVNKMSASNIAIVIAPNLLWTTGENSHSIAHTGNLSIILESFIEHCSWFFPQGVEFKRHQLSDERIDALASRFATSISVVDSPSSPEMPSLMGGGSLFSEVSKKLGWKEEKIDSVNSPGCHPVQSFYNPLAAQYDAEIDETTNHEAPLPPQKPPLKKYHSNAPTEGVNPAPYSHHKTSSVSAVPSIERSSSGGSKGELALPRGHKRNNSYGAPKRPAPPVPKIPPGGPPKTKPPEPPMSPTIPGSPKLRAPEIPTTPKPKLSSLAQNYKNSSDSINEAPA